MGATWDVEWVLGRLGRATESLPELRRTSYPLIDPLRRGWVRRQVQRLVTEACFLTVHAHDEPHVHRWAFLLRRGIAVDVDSVAHVEALFRSELEKRPAPNAPSRHDASGAVIAALCLLVVLAVAYRLAPEHWLDGSRLPISEDAFEKGGRPDPGGSDVTRLFVEVIPAFVIALDRQASQGDGQGELERAEAEALRLAKSVLGAEEVSFLAAVLSQARTLSDAAQQPAVDSFLRSVDAFNAAVERRGFGYYVDAEVVRVGPRLRVYLASFTVERVRWFRAGSRRVRALRLARRDTLNFVRGVLGFTRGNIRDALVLEERIEAWLVTDLLPALAPEARLTLTHGKPSRHDPDNLDRLERRAASEARRELASLVKGCDDFDETTRLFARRSKAFEDLAERAGKHGIYVTVSMGYGLDLDPYAAAEPYAGLDVWRELQHVSAALDDDAHRKCFRAVHEVLVSSVELHEVQHRLDFEGGHLDRLPMELERRVGPLDRYGLRSVGAERALAETSAYLSELARSPKLIKLNLARLLQHVLDQRRWGTPEYFAALVISDGLSQQLGLGSESSAQSVATRRVGNALALFLAMDEGELSRAATRLWESLLGQPLPRLTAER